MATTSPNYIRTPTGFLMVLHPGDNVLRELEQLAVKKQIPSASFTGFGFVHPTFGFWDAGKKDYNPKSFRDTELASMTGSIAWKADKPALHVHGVVTAKNFKAYGGHILALEVSTGSVEITIAGPARRRPSCPACQPALPPAQRERLRRAVVRKPKSPQ